MGQQECEEKHYDDLETSDDENDQAQYIHQDSKLLASLI